MELALGFNFPSALLHVISEFVNDFGNLLRPFSFSFIVGLAFAVSTVHECNLLWMKAIDRLAIVIGVLIFHDGHAMLSL